MPDFLFDAPPTNRIEDNQESMVITPQPHLLFVSASALASPLFHAWTRPEHWTWFITGYVFVEQER